MSSLSRSTMTSSHSSYAVCQARVGDRSPGRPVDKSRLVAQLDGLLQDKGREWYFRDGQSACGLRTIMAPPEVQWSLTSNRSGSPGSAPDVAVAATFSVGVVRGR